ncbi:AEC family transporter [Caldicellulosiruptoraceae bacterium PP1]
MLILLNAFEGIFVIAVIVVVGIILAKMNVFKEEHLDLLSFLVNNVSFPAYMVVNISKTFTKKEILNLSKGLIVPACAMIISLLIGILFTKAANIDNKKRGVFVTIFSLSNTIFVGLPVCKALFGDKAVTYVLLYYLANTTIFWTIGVNRIINSIEENQNYSNNILKRILTPPLYSFIIGIVLVMLDIRLPDFISRCLNYLGDMTTPLSMFFIGIVINSMGIKNFKLNKDNLLVLLGRFLITPLITFLLLKLIYLPIDMKKVFFVMSVMPAMVQTAIVSKKYGADYQFATSIITITTILSMIIIPIYRLLSEILF